MMPAVRRSVKYRVDSGKLADTVPRNRPIARQPMVVPTIKAVVKVKTRLPLLSPATNGARTTQECPQGLTPWMRPRKRLD